MDQQQKPEEAKTVNGQQKNKKSYFGYKLHSKMDIKHQLIREIETTPASMHDSQIDLTQSGEVTYRDRGYFRGKCKGHNATMNRATRDHPLKIRKKLKNKRITRKKKLPKNDHMP